LFQAAKSTTIPLKTVFAALAAKNRRPSRQHSISWKFARENRFVEKLATLRHHGRHHRRRRSHSRWRARPRTYSTTHHSRRPSPTRQSRHIPPSMNFPTLVRKNPVGLFNIMHEGDIQRLGSRCAYRSTVLLVFHRQARVLHRVGKIITPLKTASGAEIRTHYPCQCRRRNDHTAQEAWVAATPGKKIEVPTIFAMSSKKSRFKPAKEQSRAARVPAYSPVCPHHLESRVRSGRASAPPATAKKMSSSCGRSLRRPSRLTGKWSSSTKGELRRRRPIARDLSAPPSARIQHAFHRHILAGHPWVRAGR